MFLLVSVRLPQSNHFEQFANLPNYYGQNGFMNVQLLLYLNWLLIVRTGFSQISTKQPFWAVCKQMKKLDIHFFFCASLRVSILGKTTSRLWFKWKQICQQFFPTFEEIQSNYGFTDSKSQSHDQVKKWSTYTQELMS